MDQVFKLSVPPLARLFFLFFKLMKLGIWFLTRLFICETGPSTWSPRNATVWSRGRARGMKNDILKLTEKSVLQELVSPCSSLFNFQCLTRRGQDSIKQFVSWWASQCPPAFLCKKTFILCSKPHS